MNSPKSAETLQHPEFVTRLDHIRKSAKPSGPDWLLSRKGAAWNAVAASGFPSKKDEEWKYTDLAPLFALPLEPAKDAPGTVDPGIFQQELHSEDITLLFTDGHLPGVLPVIPSAANGLTLKKFSEISEKEFQSWLAPALEHPSGIFPVLNTALGEDGLWIHISRQVQVKPLIHLCYIAGETTAPRLLCPRVILTTEPFAEARILMTFISSDGKTASLTNSLTDISLGANAKISLVTVQNENQAHFHINSTRVTQNKDSVFENFCLTTGGRLTRNDLTVTLLETGASTVLQGLYLLHGRRHADNHTTVNHIAPHCTSNQMYKGILTEHGQAVFNGKIYVHPEAQKTNSYQLNKNLLMGEHCRINTKPQLEIFADDVKCSHGATIGQLDENEMFYLQTRGIPKKTAVRMLANGFVEDLILQVSDETVRERLSATVNPLVAAMTY